VSASTLLPDGEHAVAELRELFELANVAPELANCIEKVIQKSPPLRVANVNCLPAVAAEHRVAVYELSEELHALLTAARVGARHWNAKVVNRTELASHASPPEISVAMSRAGGRMVAEFLADPVRIGEAGWEAKLAAAAYRIMKQILKIIKVT